MTTNKTANYRASVVADRQANSARGMVDLGGSDGYDPITDKQSSPRLSLLEKLVLRSQGKPLPEPKRGRGRPRKGVAS